LIVKDRLLGEALILEHIRDAVLVDDPHIAVLWTLRAGREGCEGTDPTNVSVISYTKPYPGRRPALCLRVRRASRRPREAPLDEDAQALPRPPPEPAPAGVRQAAPHMRGARPEART